MKTPLRTGFLRLGIACVAVLALVVPSAAQALPDGYAYEKVSPADKGNGEVAGGGLVAGFRASEDGSNVLFPADGVFAGATTFTQVNAYFSERDSAKWTTDALTRMVPWRVPTDFVTDPGAGDTNPMGMSDDGTKTILQANQDPVTGDAIPAAVFRLDMTTGQTDRISPPPISGPPYVHQSGDIRYAVSGDSDYSHVLFSTTAILTPEAASASVNHPKLYLWANGETTLASWLPDGSPHSGVPSAVLVDGNSLLGPNTMAADGSAYWWGAGTQSSPPRRGQLFRGEPEVSASAFINESENSGATVAPGEAQFHGASSDGERAIFSSTQRLTDDVNQAGSLRNLYRYAHSSNPAVDQNLELISTDAEPADGQEADVRKVLGVSDDADTVYFTAGSQLVPGGPTSAGEKIYRWTAGGGTEYLAAGTVSPWPPGTTEDGRYLAFLSSASTITPDDNGGNRQVYLYDSEDAEFVCASCRTEGGEQGEVQGQPFYNLNRVTNESRRWLANDGRVFFVTDGRLSQQDINGENDLYSYANGERELINTGKGAGTGIRFADASEDGSTVFFSTREQLVDWDTDAKADLYAARLNGGQPAPADFNPRPEDPCLGDACQGKGPAAPSDPEAGSSDYAGSGNPKQSDCSALARSAQQAKQKAKRLKGKATKTKQRVRGAKGKPKAKKLRKKAQKQTKRAKKATKKAKRQKSKLAECRRES